MLQVKPSSQTETQRNATHSPPARRRRDLCPLPASFLIDCLRCRRRSCDDALQLGGVFPLASRLRVCSLACAADGGGCTCTVCRWTVNHASVQSRRAHTAQKRAKGLIEKSPLARCTFPSRRFFTFCSLCCCSGSPAGYPIVRCIWGMSFLVALSLLDYRCCSAWEPETGRILMDWGRVSMTV